MQLSDKERRLIRTACYSQKWKTMWLIWLIFGGSAVAWQIRGIIRFRDVASDSSEDHLAMIWLVIVAIASSICVLFFLVTNWRGDRKTRLLLKLVDENDSHDA
jgi:hypothetical protein